MTVDSPGAPPIVGVPLARRPQTGAWGEERSVTLANSVQQTVDGWHPAPAGHPKRVSVYLLNGFQLTVDGRPIALPVGSQRLVAFLALQHHPVRRLFVAGTLWGDSSEKRSLGNLRSCLWRIAACRTAVVDGVGASLRLSPSAEVDLVDGTRLARKVVEATPEPTIDQNAARALWEDVLPDWYDEWVVVERERFRQLRMHALEAMALQLMTVGRFAEAIEAAHAAVAAEPLRESSYRALIRVHLAEGNPVEALRAYELFRRDLLAELSLEPSPQIQELVANLIRA